MWKIPVKRTVSQGFSDMPVNYWPISDQFWFAIGQVISASGEQCGLQLAFWWDALGNHLYHAPPFGQCAAQGFALLHNLV